MKISKGNCEKIRIVGADKLDPIDLYLDELDDKAAHVTIICYGCSWTTYFGSPGNDGIKSFIGRCNASYLLNRFANGADKKRSKEVELYLLRIIEAVIDACKKETP